MKCLDEILQTPLAQDGGDEEFRFFAVCTTRSSTPVMLGQLE